METSPTPPAKTESKRMVRRAVVGVFSLVMGLWLFKAPAYLAGLEGPAWMRAGLLLLPWLVLGIFVSQQRHIWQEDELEILINRRALAFAFYAAFFGSIALHHLQAAGFIPVITWTTEGLIKVLALLLLLGLALSKLRYH